MPSYPTDFNDTVVYNGVDLYLPRDCSMTIFEDSRLFLFGEIYLNGQPILTGTGTASGSEVAVGTAEPTDPGILLWFDTSTGYGELKAKTVGGWKAVENPADTELSNEVYIGGVEPVESNYELWVDTATDVPVVGEVGVTAGNAIGVIAVGSFLSSPIVTTTPTKVTNALSCNTFVGRRYKAIFSIQASTSSSSTYVYVSLRKNGADFPSATAKVLYNAGPGFQYINYAWMFDGDGTTNLFDVFLQAGSGTVNMFTDGPSYFYIEDVGPSVTPPLPLPETSAYVTAGNALGVVAVGSLIYGDPTVLLANTPTIVSNPLSFKSIPGRRYRANLYIRTMNAASATTFNLRLKKDGAVFPGAYGPACTTFATFTSLNYSWFFDGDDITSVFAIEIQPSTININIHTNTQCYFNIEDVGPNQAPALPLPATPPAWTPLTLTGGWGTVFQEQVPQYRKIGDVVYLRGTMRALAAGYGQTAFTLPVGSRPPAMLRPFSLSMTGGGAATAGRADLGTDGLYKPQSGAGQPDYFTVDFQFSVTP